MRAAPGGGPLLVPGFKELYLALKAEGMVLTLNTNGTLLDEQWADFFARHKPRRVNITLYGADDAAYETLCRCPGATALTERTAGTARLPWARWAAGIRTAGSSGSDKMRGAAEGRSTPHFLWQKCCPALAGAGRAC